MPRRTGWMRPVLGLLLALGLGACGEPPVAGAGRLAQEGPVRVLRLEGTPEQMGYHHGQLLRREIAELADWAERTLTERAIRSPGAPEKHDRGSVRRGLDLVATQVLARLPERLRQEFEGLARGARQPFGRLLSIEVLRESIQISVDADTGLFGAVGLQADRGLGAWLGGPDSERLGRALLVIERRSPGRATTRVLTWPGSLGALAGVTSYGLGAVCIPQVVAPPERGFGRQGLPTPLALRLALERSRTVAGVVKTVPGTVGHAVGIVQPGAVEASADAPNHALYVAQSIAAEAPRVLAGRPFIALAPPPEAGGPTKEQLASVEAPGTQDDASRHQRLRDLAVGPDPDPPGIQIRIRPAADGLRLRVWRGEEADRYYESGPFGP